MVACLHRNSIQKIRHGYNFLHYFVSFIILSADLSYSWYSSAYENGVLKGCISKYIFSIAVHSLQVHMKRKYTLLWVIAIPMQGKVTHS